MHLLKLIKRLTCTWCKKFSGSKSFLILTGFFFNNSGTVQSMQFFKFGFVLISLPDSPNKCSMLTLCMDLFYGSENFLCSIPFELFRFFFSPAAFNTILFTHLHPKWKKTFMEHIDAFFLSRFFLLSFISLLHAQTRNKACVFSMDCFYFNPFIIFIRLALRPTYSLFILFNTHTY